MGRDGEATAHRSQAARYSHWRCYLNLLFTGERELGKGGRMRGDVAFNFGSYSGFHEKQK